VLTFISVSRNLYDYDDQVSDSHGQVAALFITWGGGLNVVGGSISGCCGTVVLYGAPRSIYSSNDFTETFVKVGNYPLAKSDHGVKLCENRTRENLGNRIISLEY
jgi:hypothetical protein